MYKTPTGETKHPDQAIQQWIDHAARKDVEIKHLEYRLEEYAKLLARARAHSRGES